MLTRASLPISMFPFLCLILLCLTGCPRTSDVMSDDERWAAATPAQRELQSKAMEALGKDKVQVEHQLWSRLLREYPTTPFAPQAHRRLGVLAFKKKSWDLAIQHFQQARKHRISTSVKRYLVLYEARALSKLRNFKSLKALLEPVYQGFPSHQKRAALKLLHRAAKKGKSALGEYHVQRQLWEMANDEDSKAKYRQAILDVIPKLSQKELVELLGDTESKEAPRWRFPLNFVAYRLALLHYNDQKYKLASKIAGRLLPQLPERHRLRKPVQDMYSEVRDVKRPAQARVLGVIVPQTGKYALIGQQVLKGIEMAIQNYPGVRLVTKDSGSQPDQAKKAVDELVIRHQAIAIFGPPMKATSKAAALRAQQLGVPLISITSQEGFTKLGSFVFRNNLTPSMMGRAAARYAFDTLHIRRLAVLYPSNNYGKVQAKAFLQEVQRLGAISGGAMEFDPDAQDYIFPVKMIIGTTYANAHVLKVSKAKLKRMKAFERVRLRKKMEKLLRPLVPFEGLFVPASSMMATQIAAHLAYFNVGLKKAVMPGNNMTFASPMDRFRKIQLIGNNGWYNAKQLFAAGEKYVRGAVFCVRYFRESYDAPSQRFTQDFVQRYNKDPVHVAAYSFDTMRILASIAASGKVRTRVRFRKAMLQIKQFPGPTGPMTMQPNREIWAPIKFIMAYKKKLLLQGVLQ